MSDCPVATCRHPKGHQGPHEPESLRSLGAPYDQFQYCVYCSALLPPEGCMYGSREHHEAWHKKLDEWLGVPDSGLGLLYEEPPMAAGQEWGVDWRENVNWPRGNSWGSQHLKRSVHAEARDIYEGLVLLARSWPSRFRGPRLSQRSVPVGATEWQTVAEYEGDQ